MPDYSFEAVLIRPEGVGTWTYLNIPREISSAFGSKGQVRVKGMVDRCPFRSTALPTGDGSHYLVVGKDIRDQIKKVAGDSVKVTLELIWKNVRWSSRTTCARPWKISLKR